MSLAVSATDCYLNTNELAQRWRMRPGTLRNWRASGKGPGYITHAQSGRALYLLSEVQLWEQPHVHIHGE